MSLGTIARYELVEELGRGGMATVFRAHDPRFGRDVALKVLPREFLHDPMFRQRFEREAQTIAALEHAAIVPVYDFGEQDGQPFIVMRYMPGGTLSDVIRRGPMSMGQATFVLERVGAALDEAHKRGIIHRDLKPANILFDQYGDAFLSDFGIVKLSDAATLTGTGLVGTPSYMSPEQVEGDRELDGRADQYALGIILYEMLTSTPPYQAETPIKVIMKHVTEPIPHVLQARPDLPAEVDTVVRRALAKDPDDRYPTLHDMAGALKSIPDTEVAVGSPATVEAPVEEMEPAFDDPQAAFETVPSETLEAEAPPAPIEEEFQPEIPAPPVEEFEPEVEALPEDYVAYEEIEETEQPVDILEEYVEEEVPAESTDARVTRPQVAVERERHGIPTWGWIVGGLIPAGIIAALVFGLGLPSGSNSPTSTPTPTPTVASSDTPAPTETLLPTSTTAATETALPTATNTEVPTETPTLAPTVAPVTQPPPAPEDPLLQGTPCRREGGIVVCS